MRAEVQRIFPPAGMLRDKCNALLLPFDQQDFEQLRYLQCRAWEIATAVGLPRTAFPVGDDRRLSLRAFLCKAVSVTHAGDCHGGEATSQ